MPETNHDKLIDSYLHLPRGLKPDVERIKTMTFLLIAKAKLEKSRSKWRWSAGIAAAASVVLIICLAVSLLRQPEANAGSKLIASAQNSTELLIDNVVPIGTIQTYSLPDGTEITANSNTTVSFPEKFEGKCRRVKIEGEALLRVAKDKDHPFIVETSGFAVQVLGTTFAVNNYNMAKSSVILVEGSVAISTASDEKIKLVPGQRATLDNTSITSLESVDIKEYISWTKGYRNIEGQTLETIIGMLNDMYDANIVCDALLRDKKIYGRLEFKSDINDMLSTLEQLLNVKSNYERDSIFLKATTNP